MTIIVRPFFTPKKVIKPAEGRGRGEQPRPQGKALQPAGGGPQFLQFRFGSCREGRLWLCWGAGLGKHPLAPESFEEAIREPPPRGFTPLKPHLVPLQKHSVYSDRQAQPWRRIERTRERQPDCGWSGERPDSPAGCADPAPRTILCIRPWPFLGVGSPPPVRLPSWCSEASAPLRALAGRVW